MSERIIVKGEDSSPEVCLVEFRLIFRERLPSSGNQSQGKAQHVVRRQIHPQLRRLWATNKNLRELAMNAQEARDLLRGNMPEEERFNVGIGSIAKRWQCAGYDLVPMVTRELDLRCAIDVLIMWGQEDRYVLQRGDLDGHIKTLIDGLRRPRDTGEAGSMEPADDEKPMFCLLEDDRYITDFQVTTDELLLLPDEKPLCARDVFAVIHVRLSHRNARAFGNYFG